jgi:SAM-dependent methyltransferase
MPPKPAIDYSPGSTYHERRKHLAEHAVHAMRLLFTIYEMPTSILDLGCGQGIQIGYCRHRGIQAIGVDLAVPAEESGPNLLHADLRVPMDLGISFEWVCCWEVAEHLPNESADILCDTLARHVLKPAGRLFFTAAAPGQRGPGHINCQPQEYWRDLLGDRGLEYQVRETEILAKLWLEDMKRAWWYGRNVQVFAWT